jgi:hypothetical protein
MIASLPRHIHAPFIHGLVPSSLLRPMAYLPRFSVISLRTPGTLARSQIAPHTPNSQHNSSFPTSNLFSLSSISSCSQVCINKITGPTACGRAGLYQQFLFSPKAPRYHPPYPHPRPDIISSLLARLEIWHLYIRRCIHPHHTFSSDSSDTPDTTLHHTPPHPPFPIPRFRVARPTSSNMYMVFMPVMTSPALSSSSSCSLGSTV